MGQIGGSVARIVGGLLRRLFTQAGTGARLGRPASREVRVVRTRKPLLRAGVLALSIGLTGLLVTGCGRSPSSPAVATDTRLATTRFDGGFFTIQQPRGWRLVTAGSCSEFAFFLRDPDQPLRQIFYFGQAGPVYTNLYQREIDWTYAAMGGYPTPWADMPVVDPLTPSSFLVQFPLVLASALGRTFMPDGPKLEEVQIVSTEPMSSSISGGECALLRAVFLQNGALGEGLFCVTVAPLLPFTGAPGGSIATGFLITGITAAKAEFGSLVDDLTRCTESFTIEDGYVADCIAQQSQTYQRILQTGKTLGETSDIIMQGWEERNQVHDVLSEKWSDTILGNERLYDPDTGNVYQFELGFQDRYEANREEYRLRNLEPLPEDNYDLWLRTPLDGEQHL